MVSATSEGRDSPPYVVLPGPPGTRFAEVRRFASIDSTNRYLIDRALENAQDGLVAVADYQSAGRGRLGRKWEAPPCANLLVSVLLRTELRSEDLHLLTIATALACADACAEVAGVNPDLKWPNDLYVGRQKLAGILAESGPVGDGQRVVVVGVGLNVSWPPFDSESSDHPVPDELRETATSLRREASPGRELDRLTPHAILDVVLRALEPRVGELTDVDGRRRLTAEYRTRCSTLGKRVEVVLGTESVIGVASDIGESGHLVVDTDDGLRSISAGDVVHLG